GELIGWSCGEPDDVHVAEFLDRRANDVAPERREVVALVENDRSDAISAEHVQSLPCAVAEEVAELEIAVLRTSDLALQRRGDTGDLSLATSGGLSRPGGRLTFDHLARPVSGLRSIQGPAPLRKISKRDRRVVKTSKSLICQTGDSR